jgi:ligand-binding sensor domain-containing protein/signal transduction histidine kinase/DNA-binding NarL/FixJ family response regulator
MLLPKLIACSNKRSLFLLTVLCFVISKTRGQDLVFNHLTKENGLSNNSVLSITQDAKGFMWFGLDGGLNRYDGSRFKNYPNKDSSGKPVSPGYIPYLLCDSKNTLWAGTSRGLKKYNEIKDEFENIALEKQKSLVIYCLHEDKKGTLWVGTHDGVYVSTPDKQFLKFNALDAKGNELGKRIGCITNDSKGNIWIGTSQGLSCLKPTANGYDITNFYSDPADANSLSSNSITSITEDALQNLWIGTQHNGLNLFDPSTSKFTRFTHQNSNLANNDIRKIITTRNGELWVATQEGLSIVNVYNHKIRSYQNDTENKNSLSRNSVYSLFEDNTGTLWVGTFYGGINYNYSSNTNFNIIQNTGHNQSISNNVVSSIAEDQQGNLWIGTEGGGLNYLNRNTGAVKVYKNNQSDITTLGSNLIKTVYVDNGQNVWCGTHGGGLNVMPKGQSSFKHYLSKENDPTTLRSEITAIVEDDKNRLWIASSQGLLLFYKEGTNLTPIPIQILKGYVKYWDPACLLKDIGGNIWIGGSQGLYCINNDDQVTTISRDLIVNSIQEDDAGNIWACTNDNGPVMYDKEKNKLVYFAEKNDLPANIYAMLEDNNRNFWLSSDNGLVKFNPANNISQVYTVSDGLSGNEFNINSSLKDSKGNMFFGGFNGITSFFPNNIKTNTHNAPMVFTGLRLFNNYVTVGSGDKILNSNINNSDELTFKYDQNVVTIEFALLNYIKSNKNRFSYKLEGFDKNWNTTTNSFATYTNLSPGLYTLVVKGANNDGLWSAPSSIKIKVLPPLWRSWWAYVIYTVVFISILFLLLRYLFLQALLKKEDALHQVKLNFFTNISHEIRTHLSLIVPHVENLIHDNSNNKFLSQQLTQIKSNADRLLRLVNEIMDFRKAESHQLRFHFAESNLVPFLQNIYESFRETSLQKNISISFTHNTDKIPLSFDKDQLEKVFFNLISNAFKFTQEGGQIRLIAIQEKNNVVISVVDNGRGIAPVYLDNIFDNFFQVPEYNAQNTGYGIGLALSKNIVEQHHGSIRVESRMPADKEIEGRTAFIVTLPCNRSSSETPDKTGSMAAAHSNGKAFSHAKKLEASEYDESSETLEKVTTILVVEDNIELRSLLKESLGEQYKIVESANGLQGWEVASEIIPDIIISDIMMPEMDGIELCAKLKSDSRTSHIPVILLTAKTAQNDQIAGLETGADYYIAKPFSTKILELTIKNILAAREKLWAKFAEQTNGSIKAEELHQYKNSLDKEFLVNLTQIVDECLDDPDFGVEKLSKKIAMSHPVLYKKLNAITGLTVNEFIKNQRLLKAAELLTQETYSINGIAFMVGYNDGKYFSREFKKKFGKTPREYGKGDVA